MQPYSKLTIVLPCHSLEDFPIHHRGEDASNLLANWTALWHPALIASCQQKPGWHQADNPHVGDDEFDENNEVPATNPEDQAKTANDLVLIPAVSKTMLDSELIENFEKRNAHIISDQSKRDEIIRQAIGSNEHAQQLNKQVDPELAQDFLALGYAFLQTQIMTRQLRYSSNLDEAYFSKSVVTAANFATQGEHEQCKEALMQCFDTLLEEKNGYYPVEPELIDVVLTAPTTLGTSLSHQLDADHPLNLLLTGKVCDELVRDRPQTADKLKQKINESKVTIIGGLQDELPEPLISSESTIHQLQRGRETLQRQLGVEPQVFMRRRFGLHSGIPGLLEQFGFVGAIHATLDDGKFPNSSSCNIRWTGDDDRSVLAFGDLPLSAVDAGSFLGLGVRLGEAIDSAHLAAAVFVHWPGETCESFDDLVRISNYGPLFGSFVSLNEYFESVYDPGYGDTFAADEYKSPFLKQAVASQSHNPISRFTNYWKQFYQLAACRSLLIQACARVGLDAEQAADFQNQMVRLQSEIESAVNVELETDDQTEQRLEDLLSALKSTLQPELRASDSQSEPSDSQSGDSQSGDSQSGDSQSGPTIELVNPNSATQRVELITNPGKTGTLKKQPPVLVCDSASTRSHWVVDVPSMGSVTIDLKTPQSSDVLKSDPQISDGLLLRNEFFELQVDEQTGGLRSIQLYNQRINLVSQQLAMRIPAELDSRNQPLTRARYTTMVADQIEHETESRLAGRIVSVGRILDSTKVMADFKQTIRVVRGQPLISVEVEITPREPLTHSTNHYICSRLAWKNESSRVIANVGQTRQEVNTDWFHATNFLEVVQDKHRLTMLTGGLPFHRRVSRRIVDSVLIVGNEQQRRFKFGLGVDIPYAMSAAVGWMTPQIQLPSRDSESGRTGAGENSSRWLFHFDCKNILATWWQPMFDEQSRWAGVQIRLRETEGRKGKLSIRCPREIASGEQVNLGGDFLRSLDVAKDDPTKLELEFGRFDYFQISIRWKL